MYDWGARNCEFHFCQARGRYQPYQRINMPTFLLEIACVDLASRQSTEPELGGDFPSGREPYALHTDEVPGLLDALRQVSELAN